MQTFHQTLATTSYSLRSIPQRLGNSLVIVIGIAGVVAVLVCVLAMSEGFRRTIQGDARADRVLVLKDGSPTESDSAMAREHVDVIANAPGLKQGANGKGIVSAEVVVVAPVARRRSGTDAYITLRGVSPRLFELRPELEIVSGRMFEAGLHELIIGAAAQRQFQGLDVGGKVRLHDGDWTIVGIFAGGDNVRESEVLADAQTVMSSYKLEAFNSVTALLADSGALGTFKDAVSADPRLDVDVMTEPQYLARVSGSIQRMLNVVAYAIGGIMAIGALFAALNTMYSAVVSRTSEIATLRAIGFRSRAVVVSIVVEALLLALLGALIGASIAYVAFDGQAISTLGGSRWDSQLVYSLTITPSLVFIAIAIACAIGLVGGLFPALKAARVSVAEALRA